ncbi:TIR domain-containing protein [Acinetobacter soli]|uniref:TIR domain-containing protein n=1 Tax=Acinetobacter soli TaxID=487316 RepID=UPI000DD0ED41|nr:TIR domain-containing protein [Acinetobacter soli]
MSRKIFVSYKYADTNVFPLTNNIWETTKSRDYVSKLQEILSDNDEIYKGENDGEDLSDFADSTIETKLKKKIFDSSLTIVLISPNMKNLYESEQEQWIPWEVAYSLRNKKIGNRVSRPNGMLMVVIPDINGKYDYYIEENTCDYCKCRTLKTNFLFPILKKNTFNHKKKIESDCDQHSSSPVYTGDHSYITSVKWKDFIKNPSTYLDNATRKREIIEDFNISKMLSEDLVF